MNSDERRIKKSSFEITAGAILKNETFLTSGCTRIDNALRGGFSCRGITQIYGEAGTGKTQLALQLCLTVQNTLEKKVEPHGAVYICTEAHFPSKRLQELLKVSFIKKSHSISGDFIFIEHVSTMDQLEDCICRKLSCLFEHKKIGLLIVDSIAAPYRVEYDEKNLKSRAKSLKKVGEQLHSLSRKFNMCVICINQVSAVIDWESSGIDNIVEQPTLGIVWANLVTNSFHLYKKNDRRYLRIMHSSYLPRETIEFQIRDIGVKAVI